MMAVALKGWRHAAWLCGLAALSGLVGAAVRAAAAAAADVGVDQRIRRVETALTTPVVLAGMPMRLRTIAEEMERLHVPGASVAVLHGGRIDWERGYGVTRARGPAVDAQTLFQAASISKPVTALAALRLVQQHRLDLDGDVNALLRGWRLPVTAGEHATLRELLSHTAGTTVSGFPGYASGSPVPTVDEVLAGQPPAITGPVMVDTVPGSIWRYSGGGYTVVQKLMTDVTGRPFATVMRAEVLEPAGMTRSTFAQPLDAALLARAAWPHDEAGRPVAGGPHTYPELAAAGLWSTPGDLLRYAIAVRNSWSGTRGALLDRALATAMLTPGKGGYGLGLEVSGLSTDREFSHGGSNEGYRSFLLVDTALGDGIAVMTNGSQGYVLAHEIMASVAAAYNWLGHRTVERAVVPITAAMQSRVVGTYDNPDYGSFSIGRQGAGLVISLPDAELEPLYASGPSTFFMLSRDTIFRLNPLGPRTVGHMITGGHDVRFTRQVAVR